MQEKITDNRFILINKYKNELISKTNIETSKDEMKVIDTMLFRFWQMGWLDVIDRFNERSRNIEATESLDDLYDFILNCNWSIKEGSFPTCLEKELKKAYLNVKRVDNALKESEYLIKSFDINFDPCQSCFLHKKLEREIEEIMEGDNNNE